MEHSGIRLIATDMDGTFLGTGGKLLAENCQALRDAEKAGIRIAFVSGRMPLVLSHFAKDAGLENCAVIGLNGAHVLGSPFGATEIIYPVPRATVERCAEILDHYACGYNFYTETNLYTNRSMSPERKERFVKNFSGVEIIFTEDVIGRMADRNCLKMLVRKDDDPETLARARQKIDRLPGVMTTVAIAGTFEVMSDRAGKAPALKHIAEKQGISCDEIMALGDYDNDLEMFRLCGYPVAMENASEEAARIAKYHTRTNNEAGVAWAVKRMLAGELEQLK